MTLQLETSPTSLMSSNKELKNKLQNRANRRAEVCSLVLTHREVGRKISKSILRKWRAHMPEDELNSLVDLALCEAAIRYKSEMGTQFVTFLFYHLRGHLIKTISKAKKESEFKMAFNGSNEGEGSEYFTQEAVNGYFLEKEEKALKNNPEKTAILNQEIRICKEAQEKLGHLDAEIIRRCFLNGEQVIDVAKSLELSRHYVSRIKTRALKKLKKMITTANSDDLYRIKLKKFADEYVHQNTMQEEERLVAVG